MKIVRFSMADAPPAFGAVIGEHAVAFGCLQQRCGMTYPDLDDSRAYLAGLPHSEQAARKLLAWGEAHLDELDPAEKPALATLTLYPPVEVTALFDFGLTPRHLKNSAATIMKYEQDNPQTAPLLAAFAKAVMAPKPRPVPGQPEALPYYKGNLNTIVGNSVVVPWPPYTARLDIEPELMAIYGNREQPVAGYCIFNDVSARDVQATEFVGVFCLTKDMANGNQIGPYLVTADEVGDPYKLGVTVMVDDQLKYQGSTAEISHRAEDAFAWLEFIAPLQPGSAVGLGTIPDCTGCDHDDFIDPGARITISIERLGSLQCTFAKPTQKLLPSRWPLRPALVSYAGE